MRRRTAKKHIILPDPKFKDTDVTKFVNSLMIDGKKNIAFNIFYDSINIVSEKLYNPQLTGSEVRELSKKKKKLKKDMSKLERRLDNINEQK